MKMHVGATGGSPARGHRCGEAGDLPVAPTCVREKGIFIGVPHAPGGCTTTNENVVIISVTPVGHGRTRKSRKDTERSVFSVISVYFRVLCQLTDREGLTLATSYKVCRYFHERHKDHEEPNRRDGKRMGRPS